MDHGWDVLQPVPVIISSSNRWDFEVVLETLSCLSLNISEPS